MASDKQNGISRWIWLPLWLSVWVHGLNAALIPRADIQSILTNPVRAWSNVTTVSFPDSTEFDDVTERWTTFNPPTYAAAISPGTEEDLMKIVKLAASYNISFLATGARHSYSTTIGDLRNGLAIDMSRFKSIEINQAAETVTVGPGVIMNDILDPLYEAGFILQTGTAHCPSVIGVTLGGGVGRFEGEYGLVIDAVESVRMVTATGTLVEASRTCNPDLFWAIRGAGANFGIITSATYKVHRYMNNGNVYLVDFTFPSNLSSSYSKVAESLQDNLNPKLAGNAFIIYNAATNQTQTMASYMYYGPEVEGRQAMAPIFDIGGQASPQVVTWNKLINSTLGGIANRICQPGGIHDIYSLNLKSFEAATFDKCFDKMAAFHKMYPGGRSSAVQFDFYPNQAMKAVSGDETAWPWRDTTGYMNAAMVWGEGDDVTRSAGMALGRELRADVAAKSGYPDRTVFINYSRGDETLEQIYGKDKLPRLAKLKKQWDPNHRFSFNTGLPTQYP